MKVLIPVDGSNAALAPVAHVERARRAGTPVEVVLLNVQPRFHRYLSRFSTRTSRDALRAERSAAAMARAVAALAAAAVPFRSLTEVGRPAERIAAVAARERVDEIMMGVGRHPAWLRAVNPSIAEGAMALTDVPVTVFARGHASAFERYGVPAGAVGLAALLIAAE
jgi:nucleotide-binding universal stress UspA family protein